MSECGNILHKEHQGIERADPHGALQVLDTHLRIAEKGSQKPAGAPSGCQVRIENKRVISQLCSCFNVAANPTDRKPAERKRDRIIVAQLRGSAG